MSISNFKDIYSKLQHKFPVEECIIKTKEHGIYDGQNFYLCMIIDKRFKDEVQIKKLKPYIWIGDESIYSDQFQEQYGWGWTTESGNYYVDNFENPIHEEYEVCIGFMPYENENDNELWEMF